MAKKRRHWKEKDGRYWARIAIPTELKLFFDNKTHLTEALGGDLRIADEHHPCGRCALLGKDLGSSAYACTCQRQGC